MGEWLVTKYYRGYTVNLIGGIAHILRDGEHLDIQPDYDSAKVTIDEWLDAK